MTNAEMLDVARLVGMNPRDGRYHDVLEAVTGHDLDEANWPMIEAAELAAGAKINETLAILFGESLAKYLDDTSDFINDTDMESLMLDYINKRIEHDTATEVSGGDVY